MRLLLAALAVASALYVYPLNATAQAIKQNATGNSYSFNTARRRRGKAMKPRGIFAPAVCCILIIILGSPAVAASIFRQTLQNKTEKTVNDLKIRLTAGKFSTRPLMWVDRDGDGIIDGNEFERGVLVNDRKRADWAIGKIPGITIDNLGKVFIDYTPATNGAKINATTSMWTIDGEDEGAPVLVGEPMGVQKNPTTNEATATFKNSSTVPITYSNIKLYKNNLLSNFNIPNFVNPTGTQVTVQSSISLDPGQSISLSFGVVDPGTYQLALADVSEDSTPTDLFAVATGVDDQLNVPALEGWGLVILGFMFLAGAWIALSRRGWVTRPNGRRSG